MPWKIDVEGHELDVLKGANQTLTKYKPALVVECHCASWEMLGVSRQEFIDVIHSLGYRQMTDRNGEPIDFLNQDSTIHLFVPSMSIFYLERFQENLEPSC